MRKYWTPKQIEARTNELTEILKKEKVSSNMVRLVKRRFGDLNALHSAFISSISDVHAELLLLDLSEGGSNLNDGEREGEGDGEGNDIHDGNNDAKRNKKISTHQGRRYSQQGSEKMFEIDCQKVWIAVTKLNFPAETSSSTSFSTSSSFYPISTAAPALSNINLLNLKKIERTKRQTVLTLSAKMKEFVEESDNQTEYPSYILPIYVEDDENSSVQQNTNKNENEIKKKNINENINVNIMDSESSDDEEIKKKKRKKKELKITTKKKSENNLESVAWCEIISKDEIFIFEKEGEGVRSLPDVIRRKSPPLFVVSISGIELLEAFALSYQMITDNNLISTNRSTTLSYNCTQSTLSIRNEKKSKNQNYSDDIKRSKKEVEDFEILLVSTALNVLQNRWPKQLVDRIGPVQGDSWADEGIDQIKNKTSEKESEKANSGNLSRQNPEIVLLIDNVIGEDEPFQKPKLIPLQQNICKKNCSFKISLSLSTLLSLSLTHSHSLSLSLSPCLSFCFSLILPLSFSSATSSIQHS